MREVPLTQPRDCTKERLIDDSCWRLLGSLFGRQRPGLRLLLLGCGRQPRRLFCGVYVATDHLEVDRHCQWVGCWGRVRRTGRRGKGGESGGGGRGEDLRRLAGFSDRSTGWAQLAVVVRSTTGR